MSAGEKQRRAHLVFEGRVQGVNFRATTQRIARQLNLAGWVQNLDDGTVEAVVEGPEHVIRSLVERLQAESHPAKVKRVRESWGEATGEFANFEVRGRF